MSARLHQFPRNQPRFNALDLALERPPEKVENDEQPMILKIANGVWAEKTFTFNQEFLDILALNYGAGIHLADFMHEFELARREINNWVKERTEGKIQDLLPVGSVDTDTRMALVNATYFKADWLSPFDASRTAGSPFFLLNGTQVPAKMMKQTMSFPYTKGNGFQAVELDYAGQTAAMDIILPDEGNFDAFDSSFNAETYHEITGSLQYRFLKQG